MHPLGIEPFAAGQFEQRQQHVTAYFRGTWRSGHPEAVSTTGDFDIKAAFDLPQVFIELAAEVCKATIIGGLEDYVPRNLDSIQDL